MCARAREYGGGGVCVCREGGVRVCGCVRAVTSL